MKKNSTEDHISDLNEYVNLVSGRKDLEFLDVDTPFISELRNDIADSLKNALYSAEDLIIIEETDNLFKAKTSKCLHHYRSEIKAEGKNAKYLEMVIGSNTNNHIRNKQKWWYHLTNL